MNENGKPVTNAARLKNPIFYSSPLISPVVFVIRGFKFIFLYFKPSTYNFIKLNKAPPYNFKYCRGRIVQFGYWELLRTKIMYFCCWCNCFFSSCWFSLWLKPRKKNCLWQDLWVVCASKRQALSIAGKALLLLVYLSYIINGVGSVLSSLTLLFHFKHA